MATGGSTPKGGRLVAEVTTLLKDVAGYGNFDISHKSLETWQVMEILGKNYKSLETWQVMEILEKNYKSPGTWQVLETLTKKRESGREITRDLLS